MSFNGVLEGLFVYISPCIHPITCIRGEWSAIIGGTSPVTGFSDKKCLSIHIRDDPPFFITEPHASQSVSSHAISFSVNCNSFFGVETDFKGCEAMIRCLPATLPFDRRVSSL